MFACSQQTVASSVLNQSNGRHLILVVVENDEMLFVSVFTSTILQLQ
jgi:hypothetical protein